MNPKANYQIGDINSLNFNQRYDLVLMMEILEHLRKPEKVLLKINNLASLAIFSVPHEPWFSLFSFASGRYLKTFGKHPDHLNFWNKNTFREILEKYYSKVKIYFSFPWLIAVAQK